MAIVPDLIEKLRENPSGVRFADLYAKAYQVKQVLKAIERLEIEHGTEK